MKRSKSLHRVAFGLIIIVGPGALISTGLPGLGEEGYEIVGNKIMFTYPSNNPNLEVIVSGNFNGWSKDKANWKMKFDPVTASYTLTKAIEDVKGLRKSFFEFTFRVNGQLIDATASAPNVIHCSGYGYRYTIQW